MTSSARGLGQRQQQAESHQQPTEYPINPVAHRQEPDPYRVGGEEDPHSAKPEGVGQHDEGGQRGSGPDPAAAQRLRQRSRPSSLVLSCEPTLLMRWLIPRWPAFQAAHPELEVHLMAGGGALSFDSGIDLAIRRNDFHWPEDLHSQPLFEERTGPVCQPDKVAQFFERKGQQWVLQATAPRLHTRTRPGAWQEWLRRAAPMQADEGPGQTFEHFYFSLQAAVAGLGVAIGPYRQVCDDIEAGLLVAPLGFIADGTGYHLLAPTRPEPGSPHETLVNWLHGLEP